jgi:hypothetical protein
MTEDGAMTEDERSTPDRTGGARRSTPAMDVAPELFPASDDAGADIVSDGDPEHSTGVTR